MTATKANVTGDTTRAE